MLLAFVLFYFLIELFDLFLKSISVAALLTIATNSMFLRVRDFSQVKGEKTILLNTCKYALDELGINENGFDRKKW